VSDLGLIRSHPRVAFLFARGYPPPRLSELTEAVILDRLESGRGNVSYAAESLGVSRRTVQRLRLRLAEADAESRDTLTHKLTVDIAETATR